MGSDLIVRPSYVFTESDIVTVDKLNLIATPVVELALADPVNDQNYLRNGNFYSSFWTTPAGMTCPAGIWTSNADYWSARPSNVSPFTNLTASFVQPAVASNVTIVVGSAVNTTLGAGFTQPAASATVPVTVASTMGFVAAQAITIAVGGAYTVSSVTDATHMVVTNTGAAGNAAPTAAVPTGGAVSLSATAWMSPTQAIWIVGGGAYTVVSITDATHAVVKNSGGTANAAPAATVPASSAAGVSPQNTAVTTLRSNTVPDTQSLFSAEIQGAAAVATCEFGQQINGDLSATLRRVCTFSGYYYNATGLTLSPKLRIYTCDVFNNFNAITLQSTVDLQTGASAVWTYCTATVDYSTVTNMQNGLLLAVLIPTGLNSTSNYVLFSRLKFQIGSVATPFTDDVGLFIQTPSIDSTMLQDGCIARPSLFLPSVVPTGAYQPKSVRNGDINDGSIDGRTMAAGATAANLGFTPVNKAGDTGVGKLTQTIDTVVNSSAGLSGGLTVQTTTTNAANDGYFPNIGFWRPSRTGRALGLDINGKFKTIDSGGTIGYLLDTVTKVDTNSYQDGSITLQKLATSLVNILIAPGTIHAFAGPNPPTGWFICDGSAISRTTYAALFTAIGTYWGVGDNSTTFNLPNFINRVPVGYGTGAAWGFGNAAYVSGDIGEINHTLTIGQLPSHNHSITDQQHNHGLTPHTHTYINPTGVQNAQPGIGQYSASGTTTTSAAADTISPAFSNISATNAQGGGGSHNNMQPFAMLYYIIKT